MLRLFESHANSLLQDVVLFPVASGINVIKTSNSLYHENNFICFSYSICSFEFTTFYNHMKYIRLKILIHNSLIWLTSLDPSRRVGSILFPLYNMLMALFRWSLTEHFIDYDSVATTMFERTHMWGYCIRNQVKMHPSFFRAFPYVMPVVYRASLPTTTLERYQAFAFRCTSGHFHRFVFQWGNYALLKCDVIWTLPQWGCASWSYLMDHLSNRCWWIICFILSRIPTWCKSKL